MLKKRSFLDIDPSIVEKNLTLTETGHEDELKHLFPSALDTTPTKLIQPTPGFCVKGKSEDDEKIFVNVCQTDAIPPPKDISEKQLFDLVQLVDTSGLSAEYKVPMSIGEPRVEQDKSGNDAICYDVAINSDFFKKVEESEFFKRFFLLVLIEGIQDKFNVTLKENVNILKNRKAMGKLQLHRIQQRVIDKEMKKEKKLIEEIDVPTPPVVEAKKTSIFRQRNVKVLPYRLLEVDKKVILAEIHLPDVVSLKDISLDVGEDRIVFEYKKNNVFLDIFIPCFVKNDEATAELNRCNGILTITMPIVRIA